MKNLNIFLLILVGVYSLFAQELEEEAEKENPGPSLRETRRDILEFGIESEVLEVLDVLKNQRDYSYNPSLLALIQTENSSKILEPVFHLFAESNYEEGRPFAEHQLQLYIDDDTVDDKVLISALTYLAKLQNPDSVSLFYDVIQEEDDRITAYALSQLGKFGANERSIELEDLFNDNEEEENEIATNIILAWGDMAYQPAVDILLDIVSDEYAEKVHREYAAVSLGKIGDLRGLEPVRELFNQSEDATVRSYALSGLTYFDDPQVDDILIQALRRDSFWRIRVTAAEGLAERGLREAVDLLDYKLRRDPEVQVKEAAAAALAELGGAEASQYLKTFLLDEKQPESIRLKVLKSMLKEEIPGTVEALIEIMEKEWDKKDTQGKFMEYLCRESSLVDWNALSPAFARMLEHHNPYVQIYGVRGISRIKDTSLYDAVINLDKEGVNGLVRREAVEELEALGIKTTSEDDEVEEGAEAGIDE